MSNRLINRFSYDESSSDNARIKVIGVGGGGGNAITNMIKKGLNNVEYIALNTDAQALKTNPSDVCIQVGKSLTNGLGAGARPEIGREAVEENRHEIEEAIEGADMVFITAGMGGGTGTGGAPVVAGIAKRKGILTVGIVTTPFVCEGRPRMRYATDGINDLKKNCDTVIVIPNERLLDICDADTSLTAAFEIVNEVLYNATRGISDLILLPGLINLDFADVRTTMQDGGAAIMGSATASGPDRAEIAAREAINSPLLDGISIRGARNVLVNISANETLGMREVTTATKIIQSEAGEDAEIIMGTVMDAEMGDELRMTVIATGFELSGEQRNKIKITTGAEANGRVTDALTGRKPSTLSTAANGAEAGRRIPSPDELTRRFAEGRDTFYKGEKNLKHLDTPAAERRGVNIHEGSFSQPAAPEPAIRQEEAPIEPPRKFGTGNVLLNNREERISKGDSDQPAFLRRAMD
jgi:cell division protein FtsZ